MHLLHLAIVLTLSATGLAACGDDGGDLGSGRPRVVATTSVLGDLVGNVIGDQAQVEVVMPAGVDPHDFQPSAQQVAMLRDADAVVVNGGGFEEGLLDVIESAEGDGVPTFHALDAVAPLAADGHAGEEAAGEGAHDHGGDPHFFADPLRTAEAVRAIGAFLAEEVEGIDGRAVEAAADRYARELEALHAEVEEVLAAVPDERRVLVTGHEVLAYFADRYGFEVVGTVIPATSTADGGSAGDLALLADAVRTAGVPAIFVDDSAPEGLARTLADEVGDVDVVPLLTESLAEPGSEGDTYVGMLRTNAARIAEALGAGRS